jgi:hypothetical protein
LRQLAMDCRPDTPLHWVFQVSMKDTGLASTPYWGRVVAGAMEAVDERRVP